MTDSEMMCYIRAGLSAYRNPPSQPYRVIRGSHHQTWMKPVSDGHELLAAGGRVSASREGLDATKLHTHHHCHNEADDTVQFHLGPDAWL